MESPVDLLEDDCWNPPHHLEVETMKWQLYTHAVFNLPGMLGFVGCVVRACW